MSEIILKGSNICKSFANNGVQNHVLNNIDIEIYKDDFTIIMGSSGSGKSTLLYCLNGMDSLTAGVVEYKDKILSKLKEKEMASLRYKEFGFIFQQVHLVSNLSICDNILVPGYLDHLKGSQYIKDRADELLKLVNIYEAKDRLPSQVSGG